MKVSLEQILAARDNRQRKRLSLSAETGLPVVVLTVNYPGETKSDEISDYIFEIGIQAVCEELLDEVKDLSVFDAVTGNEAFFAVNCDDVKTLKQRMCAIEDWHFLGRLFDIDVYDEKGRQLSRNGLGIKQRKCLVCERDARSCARSRAHPVDGLLQKIKAMKEEYETLYD